MARKHGTAAHANSGATNADTFGSAVAVGDLLTVKVAQIFGANPVRSISSVADSLGNTYTVHQSKTDAGGNRFVAIYDVVSAFAGTPTVTVTFSAAADSDIGLDCFDSTYTVRAGSPTSAEGTTSPITAGAVNPASAAQFVFATTNDGGGAMTPPGGWNVDQQIDSTGTCPLLGLSLATSGSQNPSTAIAAGVGTWVAILVAYTSAAKILTAAQGAYRLVGMGTVPDNSMRPGALGEFDPELRADCWFDREGLV
jgi:hypothetical protein